VDRETGVAPTPPDPNGRVTAPDAVHDSLRPRTPNVVMIATPHIDDLAANGLRYNNFHVTALCAPTRACLLTGRNHHAVGMGILPEVANPDAPGYRSRLPRSAAALPRMLRDAGYSTFAVGKWHLTPMAEKTSAGPFDRWPLGTGFERYYGFLGGATNQWTPDLVRDNGFIEPPHTPDDGYHLTEDLVSQAMRLVQDQRQSAPDKPFFLYLATGAMHSPHQAPADWIERYRGRFDAGWEAARRRAFRAQLEAGVIPAGTTMTERPPWVPPWDDQSPEGQRLFARQMEVYAGFLSHTDAQIGRLLDALARFEVLDNTLIMVLSDNGAAPGGSPDGTLGWGTSTVESMLAKLPEVEPGGFKSWNHYAWGWAWAGNTPFRLWKHYTWLGGVRVPLIVHWPGGIPSTAIGNMRPQFCHAIDLMPTILDATGCDLPDAVDGETQQPVDGQSIVGTFHSPVSPAPRNTQYFEMQGSRAIYHDGWKATTNHVTEGGGLIEGSHKFEADQWSLFRLEDDFAEAHDLADTHPRQLQRLIHLWWHEAGRNQVLPLDDRPFVDRWDTSDRAHGRNRYVYLPNGGPIATPPLATGWHLTADIEINDPQSASGIICAQGNWNAGWACYLLDGRPTVTFNFDGSQTRIAAEEPAPPGNHRLEVNLLPSPNDRWLAEVSIDKTELGRGEVSITWGRAVRLSYAKLLIGRDSGFAVCDDYRSPFAFTGSIHRIVLEIPAPGRAQ
jgi:arylsulfatase A-like enzyme